MEMNSGISDNLRDNLLKLPYVTRANIELILGDNRRTVDYRISSLIKRRQLLKIKRGLYLSLPYYNKVDNKTNFIEYISSIIVQPCYISLQYALSQYGLIPEAVYSITAITYKKTREFNTPVGNFIYRNIKKELYKNYNERLFDDKRYYIASPAKSLFDLLYLNTFVDTASMKQYLIFDSRINWDVLQTSDKSEFREIVESTKSTKMNSIVSILTKEKLL